jgi:hypothetical protein
MVINTAGTVVFTANVLGNTCDVDFRESAAWKTAVAHAAGDFVAPTGSFGGDQFMAQNAGTTGATEPAWPAAFGATVTDGTITWVNSGQTWLPSTAYTAGMVAQPTSPGVYRIGFLYKATNTGTTAATAPVWPTTIGGTVVDGTVTWQAIGYYPGSFVGCTPMQIVSRASGGADTVIASEGDLVGASQLSGWSEFMGMNSSGKIAVRSELAGFIRNDDESSSTILTMGPGAGAITQIAKNGDTIGGRFACGYSAMVNLNDAGQVVFDAYAPQHNPTWTANTTFANGDRVYPTGSKLLVFQAGSAGTSGATEPTWPTTPGLTVADGGITWTGSFADCDEDDHGIVRFTQGPGNQLLVQQGSTVGVPSSTVIGFGRDDDTQTTGRCNTCDYGNIEGRINSAGHVAVVLNLADGTQGVFNYSGPGTSTQVARSSAPAGPQAPTGGFILTDISPRVSWNNTDQVVYKATDSVGTDHLFLFTPPSTTVAIISVGDAFDGSNVTAVGPYSDINASGHVVFMATTAASNEVYGYYDGTTHVVSRQPASSTGSEMISLNDANQVAYVTGVDGSGGQDETDGGFEGHETGGAFSWTLASGSSPLIQVGDVINGAPVTAIYAEHPTFAGRQWSPAGCLATAYTTSGDDPEFDCSEGGGRFCTPPLVRGGQLFVSCATGVCPVITIAPPTLPAGTQGMPYNQQLVASGGQAPYTYTVSIGTTPPGTNLSAGGLLNGTPTTTGTFNFTVTATDANNCTGTISYSFVIGAPTQVTIALAPPARLVVVGNSSNFTASINIPQSTATIVTLTSSNPSIATVPATVTILANQTSAIFTVNGVALGGPITVTATLPASFGATPATASVTVVAAPAATVPTLSTWALMLLATALAAAGFLLSKRL